MKEIGVRDLKSHLTKVIRAVHEEAVEYTVTLHGQPVAVIRPYTVTEGAEQRKQQVAAELALFEQLAEQVGESWQSDRNSAELLEELREESACR